MPYVVVVGAIMKCLHGGQSKLLSGNSKFNVQGAAAVTSGMEVGVVFLPGGPGVIAPCTFSTGAGPSPCAATTAALPAGISTKITVGGVGVLLDTASGLVTNPALPGATWSIGDAGQSVVQDD